MPDLMTLRNDFTPVDFRLNPESDFVVYSSLSAPLSTALSMLRRQIPSRILRAGTRSAWGTSAPAPAPVQLAFDVIEPQVDKRPGENLVVCHGLL